MTSEELELSLKAEFESYLDSTFASMRQDVAEFQKNFEAEFEKHRLQMEESFRSLASRFEQPPAVDRGFAESVIEHLRLARDEGAQLAASAFTEAEKLAQPQPAEARYDNIRNAVSDISSRVTQSEILGTLIDAAAHFAPRGTFFIVKGDELVAWRSFGEGSERGTGDTRIPVSADTILRAAVLSSATADGSYGTHRDDDRFVGPLELGRPDRMYAVPLVARGRAVAVLYADYGNSGHALNVEALETLVRVAALTVELRAASRPSAAGHAKPAVEESSSISPESSGPEEAAAPDTVQYVSEPEQEYPPVETEPEPVPSYEVEAAATEEAPRPDAAAPSYEFESTSPAVEEEVVYEPAVYEAPAEYVQEVEAVSEPAPATFEYAGTPEPVDAGAFAFAPAAEVKPVAAPEPEFVSAGYAAEPAVQPAPADPARHRLSDRNIDLPIEVGEEERKLHNNARRFARLLVSEIKLYNEQKVVEGREAGDLYGRLREAIDRSREMYEKRVEPTVAAKFDYFHYELLNDLAQGDPTKLGPGYPKTA